MPVSFLVSLSQFKLLNVPGAYIADRKDITRLNVYFGKFKKLNLLEPKWNQSFVTNSYHQCSIIFVIFFVVDESSLDFSQETSFFYESHNYSFLTKQIFRIVLDSETNDSHSNIIEIPISTLALLPSLHQIDIKIPTINQKMILQYYVEMTQTCEMKIQIENLKLQLPNPLNCFIRCSFEDQKGTKISFETEQSIGDVLPSFSFPSHQGFLQCCTSLKQIFSLQLRVELLILLHNQSVPYGEAILPIIPLLSSVFVTQQESNLLEQNIFEVSKSIPFYGFPITMNQQHVCFLEGKITCENIPIICHLQNGKYTNRGIIGHSLQTVMPGLQMPLTIPIFESDSAAVEFHRTKESVTETTPLTNAPSITEVESMFTKDSEKIKRKMVLLIDANTPETIRFSREKLVIEHNSLIHDGLITTIQGTEPITALKHAYFEIRIESSGTTNQITIGLATQDFPYNIQTGLHPNSFGYRSDTGRFYSVKKLDKMGEFFGPKFGVGDTIGVGINLQNGGLFYTLNGQFVGYAFFPVTDQSQLFPTISLHSYKSKVRCNFDNSPYLFADVSNSNLPNGWTISKESQEDRFYFENQENRIRTQVDPWQVTPLYQKYQLQQSIVAHHIMEPLLLRQKLQKKTIIKSWKGIHNSRLRQALIQIPRTAFVPEELMNSASTGQHMKAELNSCKIEIPSTFVISKALDALDLKPNTKFLCMGSGSGYITALAAAISKEVVIGEDANEQLVEMAENLTRKFIQQSGIRLDNVIYRYSKFHLSETSLPSMTTADCFDAIFCVFNIPRERLPFFSNYLNPQGGKVVVSVGNTLILATFVERNGFVQIDEKVLLKNISFADIPIATKKEFLLEEKQKIIELVKQEFQYLPKPEIIEESFTFLVKQHKGAENKALIEFFEFLQIFAQLNSPVTTSGDQVNSIEILNTMQIYSSLKQMIPSTLLTREQFTFSFLQNYKAILSHFKDLFPERFLTAKRLRELFIVSGGDWNICSQLLITISQVMASVFKIKGIAMNAGAESNELAFKIMETLHTKNFDPQSTLDYLLMK